MSSPEWSLMGQAGTGQPPTRGAHGRGRRRNRHSRRSFSGPDAVNRTADTRASRNVHCVVMRPRSRTSVEDPLKRRCVS